MTDETTRITSPRIHKVHDSMSSDDLVNILLSDSETRLESGLNIPDLLRRCEEKSGRISVKDEKRSSADDACSSVPSNKQSSTGQLPCFMKDVVVLDADEQSCTSETVLERRAKEKPMLDTGIHLRSLFSAVTSSKKEKKSDTIEPLISSHISTHTSGTLTDRSDEPEADATVDDEEGKTAIIDKGCVTDDKDINGIIDRGCTTDGEVVTATIDSEGCTGKNGDHMSKNDLVQTLEASVYKITSILARHADADKHKTEGRDAAISSVLGQADADKHSTEGRDAAISSVLGQADADKHSTERRDVAISSVLGQADADEHSTEGKDAAISSVLRQADDYKHKTEGRDVANTLDLRQTEAEKRKTEGKDAAISSVLGQADADEHSTEGRDACMICTSVFDSHQSLEDFYKWTLDCKGVYCVDSKSPPDDFCKPDENDNFSGKYIVTDMSKFRQRNYILQLYQKQTEMKLQAEKAITEVISTLSRGDLIEEKRQKTSYDKTCPKWIIEDVLSRKSWEDIASCYNNTARVRCEKHNSDGAPKSSDCIGEYPTVASLIEHLCLESEKQSNVCNCGESFLKSVQLLSHMKTHEAEDAVVLKQKVSCFACGATFENAFERSEHCNLHRACCSLRPCMLCEYSASSYKICEHYANKHFADATPTCKVCSEEILKANDFITHLIEHIQWYM